LRGSTEIWGPFVSPSSEEAFDPARALFIDTETTGLGGGGGTYAFLVGMGRFEGNAFVVRQLFMPDYDDEGALLDLLAESVQDSGGLVSFNGRAFDWPLLASRYVMDRRPVPGQGLPHLDLLLLSRRLWREMLPSCSLASLEEHVLGLERSFEDVAGHLIPDIYRRYVKDGDAGPLDGVFYHNLVDVLSMVSLAQVAADIARDGLEMVEEPLCDAYALGRLYEGLGRASEATQAYRQARGERDEGVRAWEAGWREAMLHKRRGAFEAAVSLWSRLVDGFRLDPYVELAKYHEHRSKDLAEARRWVVQGQVWLREHASEMEQWRRERLEEQLAHRLRRIDGKLSQRAARGADRGATQ
ncbi:MAG: ribonuclease H-like domain-containing protein, partial [Anaerolineae bacterium]